jgi:2-oxoglutarate ferredoxin oxidoreductase subunit beta
VRSDRVLYLEHGQPMIFGANRDKGIRLNGMRPEVASLGENGVTANDILVHNARQRDPFIAFMLSRLEFPQVVGVFRDVERPTYDDMLHGQIEASIAKRGPGDLEKLIHSGETWVVE